MALTKLTLSADKELIDRAKVLARRNKTSLSSMFSRILMKMAAEETRCKALGPLTQKASGIIRLGDQQEREVLADALRDKYEL